MFGTLLDTIGQEAKEDTQRQSFNRVMQLPNQWKVLDCFLGSGSTKVASHQLKRTCYGSNLALPSNRLTECKLDETLTVKINGKEYKKEAEKVPF